MSGRLGTEKYAFSVAYFLLVFCMHGATVSEGMLAVGISSLRRIGGLAGFTTQIVRIIEPLPSHMKVTSKRTRIAKFIA